MFTTLSVTECAWFFCPQFGTTAIANSLTIIRDYIFFVLCLGATRTPPKFAPQVAT